MASLAAAARASFIGLLSLVACRGGGAFPGGGLSGLARPTVYERSSAEPKASPAERFEDDELPALRQTLEAKTCARPAQTTPLSTVYRDGMGYSIPDNTWLNGVEIRLKKGESISVGGRSCAHFTNVVIVGGELLIGGASTVVLDDVRIRGEREALTVGGDAHVSVERGEFHAETGVLIGGGAVVKLDKVAIRGQTALSLGGGASLRMIKNRIRCEGRTAFDECLSVGGRAIARLDDVISHSDGRALGVGGGAFVVVSGGKFTSGQPEYGAGAFDVMGEAVLVLLNVTLRESASVNAGGDGKAYIRGGDFDPPLTRNGRRR